MADQISSIGTMSPEDYAQQQAANRQQQMAQLLLQQGVQGQQQPAGQMVSGRYVPNSFFQNLVPLANMAASQYVGAKADTEMAKLAQKIRENKTAAEQKILDKFLGTEAVPGQAPVIPQGQTLRDDNGMLTYGAQEGTPGKAATKPDLAAALREIESPTNYYGAGKDLKSIIVNRLNPEKPSSVLEFEYAKEHPELVPYLFNKAAAGAARTSLNVQNQLPFKEQIQKEAATGLMKNFETLQNIPSTLQNMDKMVKLSQQPIYAGVGGESKLQIAKLLNNNFGTNIGKKEIENTEEFKAAAYMGIMENLKKTDSNPTMAQQNALKDAIGSLGTDPSALPRVVNVMRDVLVNKATQHNELVRQTMQNGVQYPYSIEIPLPKTAPATSGLVGNIDTNSLDAILKARGAIK